MLAISPMIGHYPSMTQRYAIIALVSAALFGLLTPAAKLLLGSIDPAVLAGVLYRGVALRRGRQAASYFVGWPCQ